MAGRARRPIRKLPHLVLVAALAVVVLDQGAATAQHRDTQSLIAPPGHCAAENDFEAPAEVQQRAMLCMTAYARRQAGLAGLSAAVKLELSAAAKAGDILGCNSFSHLACGRSFTYWLKAYNYLPAPCWAVGENLAWGTGREGTVRSVFRSWMHSPGHRHDILGDFSQIGISMQIGDLDGQSAAHVWTQDFGSHCRGRHSRR